jgi:hypothetical protein
MLPDTNHSKAIKIDNISVMKVEKWMATMKKGNDFSPIDNA